MTSNERALEVLRKAKLTRYEHGGGRLFVDGPAGARELVADFYNEDTRELIMSLIEAAIHPVETACDHAQADARGNAGDLEIYCSKCGQVLRAAVETTPCNEVSEARDLLQRIREGFNSERDESNWNIDLDAWLKRNSSPEERSGSKGPITRADAGRYWHECPHGAGYTDFPEGPCRHCWPLKTSGDQR